MHFSWLHPWQVVGGICQQIHLDACPGLLCVSSDWGSSTLRQPHSIHLAVDMGQQKVQVQHTGPLLVSCVHYSVAGESSPFLLLSASCSLEIAKVAAKAASQKPECKLEALPLPFPAFPPWSSRAASLDHRKSPPRTACPCSWSWLLVLLGPALPCLLASPHFFWAAASCWRQWDLPKGLEAIRQEEPWIASWHPIPTPGAGAACCPHSPQVGCIGLWVWRGAPWGWGWLGNSILPEPWFCLSIAVVRIGNLYPAVVESSDADSSQVPVGSCKGFCSCSGFYELLLIESLLYKLCAFSCLTVYMHALQDSWHTFSFRDKVVFKYNVLVVKWWLTCSCCGCTKAVYMCIFTWQYKVLVCKSWIV